MLPYLRRATAAAGVLLAVLTGALRSEAQQLTVEPKVLVIPKDKPDASWQLQVCNTSRTPAPAKISLSTFQAPDEFTKNGTLTSAKGSADAGPALRPGECTALQIAFTGISQIAMLSGELLSNNLKITQLLLVRENLSYGLSVDGATSDKPEVRLVRPDRPGGFSSRIFIKNSDSFPYDLRFAIDLDSAKCWERSHKTFSIGANTSKEVYLDCDPTLFDWFRTGFLKSDTRVRQAALDVMAPNSDVIVSTKRPAITAVVSYFSEWVQQLWNVSWSLVILIVGALLSVVMTIVLPNYRRKKDLLRRLEPIREELRQAGPTSRNALAAAFPGSADHERARLLLQLEAKRLEGILEKTRLISQDAGTRLSDVQAKTDIVERKLALFRRVDTARMAAFDPNVGHLPPSVLERVNRNCEIGILMLEREALKEEDWTNLEQLVSESEQLLTGTGQQLSWLEDAIRGIEQAVQELLCNQGPPKTLKTPVVSPWDELCDAFMNVIPGMDIDPFFPGQYAPRDRRAVFFTYIRRYAAIEELSLAAPQDTGWQTLKTEFKDACKQRLDLVRLRTLMEQLEQGISRDAIIHKIRSRQIQISPGEPICLTFSPIRFQVIFPGAPHFNVASARQDIRVSWKFDTPGKGCEGWEIWHYFPEPQRQYTVTASFSINDDPIKDDKGEVVAITAQIRAHRDPLYLMNPSKWTDRLQFALTVLTATFALSSVRQLLPNADVVSATVGVLAFGFTADVFRNLLSSRKS